MAIFTGLIEFPDKASRNPLALISVYESGSGAPATLVGVAGNVVVALATGFFQFETTPGEYLLRIQVGDGVQEETVEVAGGGENVFVTGLQAFYPEREIENLEALTVAPFSFAIQTFAVNEGGQEIENLDPGNIHVVSDSFQSFVPDP